MSIDIGIDREKLAEFIQVLSAFQELTIEKFGVVDTAWIKCNESWEAKNKGEFTKDFEETKDQVERALEAGEDAIKWLRDFDETLEEFEQNYY